MATDSHNLGRIVEFGEAEAYADLYEAAPVTFARQHGIHLSRIGPAVVLTTAALDIPLFNRVLGLGVHEPAAEASLDQALEHFAARAVQHYAIQISPVATPPTLADWLAARSLTAADSWVKMFRGVEPPPVVATSLKIDTIGPELAGAFSDIAVAAFGLPAFVGQWLKPLVGRAGWRHYLAFDEARPVGCGALFVRDRIGWLGIGGTLREQRGRGAQGAIMARRIQDAIAAGCEWIITETGEETTERPNPSYRNMVRMGFRLAYPRPNFVKS